MLACHRMRPSSTSTAMRSPLCSPTATPASPRPASCGPSVTWRMINARNKGRKKSTYICSAACA